MNEGSAGQGCWFESLLQGPMMTYKTCEGSSPNLARHHRGCRSLSTGPSTCKARHYCWKMLQVQVPQFMLGVSIFRFDDQQKD